MENKKAPSKIDPIGVEVLISIFSTSLAVVSFLHQLGVFSRNRNNVREKIAAMHREVLRAQNSLDDFVLILHRYSSQSEDFDPSESSITITETLFNLEQVDYIRWLDLQDSIKSIDQKIYSLISEVREFSLDYLSEANNQSIDSDLTSAFDKILLQMGKMSFGDFIAELRKLLNLLSEQLRKLVIDDG